MNRNPTFPTLIVSILFLLAGCTAQRSPVSGAASSATSEPSEWRPRGQMFFVAPEGKYIGAVPCKDCPGIEVSLDFKKDNSVVKSMRYIQSKIKNSKVTGTWVVTAGNIIQISYNKAPQEYYKAQNGGHLVMLNSKKELNINPSQAQFFIFNKD
jgi:hypothetical protein